MHRAGRDPRLGEPGIDEMPGDSDRDKGQRRKRQHTQLLAQNRGEGAAPDARRTADGSCSRTRLPIGTAAPDAKPISQPRAVRARRRRSARRRRRGCRERPEASGRLSVAYAAVVGAAVAVMAACSARPGPRRGRPAAKLQRAYIGDDGPAVSRRDTRGVGIHDAVAIGDHVEEMLCRARRAADRNGRRAGSESRAARSCRCPGRQARDRVSSRCRSAPGRARAELA